MAQAAQTYTAEDSSRASGHNQGVFPPVSPVLCIWSGHLWGSYGQAVPKVGRGKRVRGCLGLQTRGPWTCSSLCGECVEEQPSFPDLCSDTKL